MTSATAPGAPGGHRHDDEHTDHADHADQAHEHERDHEHEQNQGRKRGHGHSHDHGSGGHAGHSHGVSADADRRYLTAALALIGLYMLVEVVIGVIAQSLALITDAGHMLTDAVSIVLALVAMRLAARPARGRWTYGLKRAEILSAQVNGITLLLLVVWFTYEAVRRLISPPDVAGGLVVVTAVAGIVINVAAAWLISRANRTSLNVEGAYQHILNDLWAFIATAISGVIVLTTGFARADAIASLVVAGLMLKAGVGLVRESWKILLEAAPAGLDPDLIGGELAAQEGVAEVHDLHIWTITSGFPALSAHVLVDPGHDCHAVQVTLQRLLRARWDIDHTTLQVDHAPPGVWEIADAPGEADAHCADPHGTVHRPTAPRTVPEA
ncbi:cation diffusion facilitator family transporter [Yinghuangia seranimata]|uniref:cation diffusion facilitator family transporter n=1 Tax=Yinghuangia seranimata TaxID=408067 RepID=UPI00248C9DBC|nr:cation diffusion facilitator family transporter [Yinghuangia seranimata]MDI2129140.1 cation diffusion facilitator family transporter [Yinghuangia seranimata]